MKTICAWCDEIIRVTCNHCGHKLLKTTYPGSAFDTGAMVCINGDTAIVYTSASIQAMPTIHGICQRCAALPEQTRDALLTERHKKQAELSKAAPREAITDQPNQSAHIPANTAGKRGPMGVTPSATARAEKEQEKK